MYSSESLPDTRNLKEPEFIYYARPGKPVQPNGTYYFK